MLARFGPGVPETGARSATPHPHASTFPAMIEVRGLNGESLQFDGEYVRKFRHDGKEESAVNPAATYRETQVKAKKAKKQAEPHYEVLVACATIFALTVPESEKPALDAFVAALEATRAVG